MKFIIKSFLLAGLLTIVGQLQAQERYFDERSTFTQHFLYPTLLNPGAIGNTNHQVFVSYRNTWAGFDGAPQSILLDYNGTIADRLGFGAQIFSDSYGAEGTTKGQVGASYTIKSDVNTVGLGLSTEFIQHGIVGGLGGIDPTDEVILQRLEAKQFLDVSFGAYGVYNDKLTYGVAFPSLLSSRISDTGSDISRELGVVLQLGYEFKSESTGITLKPNLAVKKLNHTPTHVDLNALFVFLDGRFNGGLGYTIGGENRLGFLLGTNVDNLSVNYSYGLSSGGFQQYNNGSHELTVGLRFGKSKKMEEKIMEVEEVEMGSN